MAIEFDGTAGEFVSSSSGSLPNWNSFTALAVVRPDTLGFYSGFFSIEKIEEPGEAIGCSLGHSDDICDLYDYTGHLVCSIGAMVAGGVYGIAITSSANGPTANAVKAYLRRLDVLGVTQTAQGNFAESWYSGPIQVFRAGGTQFDEPMDGGVQNMQLHNVVLTKAQIEAAWMERAPTAVVTPLRWWPANGPNLAAACVDVRGQGDLGVTGSLAYSAGWSPPSMTYSETHTGSVTVAASHVDTHEPAPVAADYPVIEVTPADAYGDVALFAQPVADAVTVGDSWVASVLSGSGLSDTFLSGGPANDDGALSIGGPKSTEQAARRLFGRVTRAQHAAGLVRYRCIYPSASAGPITLQMFISHQPTNALIEIGWAAAAKNVFEDAIADESTAPAGVTFSAPSGAADAISSGTLNEGDWRGFWIKQTLLDVAPAESDPFVIEAVPA